MSINVEQEMESMRRMSIDELRDLYARVFGEATTIRHAQCLIKRIIWRRQAAEAGGLSQRARERAKELTNEAELRMTAPRPQNPPPGAGQTMTLPAPAAIRDADVEPAVGTQFERLYKGQRIVVTIVENGVRWNGDLYRSLSAVAKVVTGSHWNGKNFFGLTRRAAA